MVNHFKSKYTAREIEDLLDQLSGGKKSAWKYLESSLDDPLDIRYTLSEGNYTVDHPLLGSFQNSIDVPIPLNFINRKNSDGSMTQSFDIGDTKYTRVYKDNVWSGYTESKFGGNIPDDIVLHDPIAPVEYKGDKTVPGKYVNITINGVLMSLQKAIEDGLVAPDDYITSEDIADVKYKDATSVPASAVIVNVDGEKMTLQEAIHQGELIPDDSVMSEDIEDVPLKNTNTSISPDTFSIKKQNAITNGKLVIDVDVINTINPIPIIISEESDPLPGQ